MNGKEKDRARCISTVTQRDGQLASLNGTKHSWGRTSLDLWRDLLSHLNAKYVNFFFINRQLGRLVSFPFVEFQNVARKCHFATAIPLFDLMRFICLFVFSCSRAYFALLPRLHDPRCYICKTPTAKADGQALLCDWELVQPLFARYRSADKRKKYFAKCQRARKIDMCRTRSAM